MVNNALMYIKPQNKPVSLLLDHNYVYILYGFEAIADRYIKHMGKNCEWTRL